MSSENRNDRHRLNERPGPSVLVVGRADEFLRRPEPVCLNRGAKASITIRAPAPSVVLSGTPGQVSDLFTSDEGLFSRISLYRFDVEPEWHSQFGSGSAGGSPWDELADRMATARTQLAQRDRPLPVEFASGARQVIDRAHQTVQERCPISPTRRALHSPRVVVPPPSPRKG